MSPPLYEQEMRQGAERVEIGHRHDLRQDLLRWWDSQGWVRPFPCHEALILDMLQAAGLKEIKHSPAEDIGVEISVHAARAEGRTVGDQIQIEAQLEQARASFNESVERERQAAAETCKAAEQHVTNTWRRSSASTGAPARSSSRSRSDTTLTEQAHGHAQRVHELTAERDDLLEECRRWRAAAEHQKSLAEKPVTLTVDRDEWRQRFESMNAVSHALATQLGEAQGLVKAEARANADLAGQLARILTEYRQTAQRLWALRGFETEPDGRPICVRCGRAWTPEEGIDAKVVPCRQCIPSAPDGV